jgi:hypothetical protein
MEQYKQKKGRRNMANTEIPKQTLCEIKEQYLSGEKSLKAISDSCGISYSKLRAVSVRENWREIKKREESMTSPLFSKEKCKNLQEEHLRRHLQLTDKLLSIAEKALENEDDLFIHVEVQKSASAGTAFLAEKLPAIDEVRLGRLVKALGDIFELQRAALSIPAFKEAHDAHLTSEKLKIESRLAGEKEEREREIAIKKLELELLKLERGAAGGVCGVSDSLLSALSDDDCEEESGEDGNYGADSKDGDYGAEQGEYAGLIPSSSAAAGKAGCANVGGV